MKLALECPTQILYEIQPLADYDFILTHLVFEDKTYRDYYKSSKRWKILDNSCNELLKPVPISALAEAAELVEPDLIVAPDYLGDSKRTLESIKESIRVFGIEKVLPVVQGSSYKEALNCFEEIASLGCECIAVPYDMGCERTDHPDQMALGRMQLVTSIISRVPISYYIHLLGMTTLEELTSYASGWIKSVDTGVPIMMGLDGRRLGRDRLRDKSQPTLSRMVSKDNYYDLGGCFYNIAYLRKVLA